MHTSIQIVGILNTTPDSYYDGGQYTSTEASVKRASKILEEGGDIIEIGGESTGPGSSDVSLDEELGRVIPVIEAIREQYPDAILSVDTYKSEVARACLDRGVTMINDITAGRGDPDLFSVVSTYEAKIVLMYAKDNTPRTTIADIAYDDVIATISTFLQKQMEAAQAYGISKDNIIIDPGLGHFVSADPAYSFEIIDRLGELKSLHCPILVSPSRKSFLAGPTNLPPSERLPATLEVTERAVGNGARYVRTHDAGETNELIAVS